MVQQRTSNSGWVDTIWTFSLRPQDYRARYRDYQSRTSPFFRRPSQKEVAR
jgi:steroid 5-alpha reductase family enzyme